METSHERATLTVPQAAEALGLSVTTTYARIADGSIPALRLGRRIVIPRAAFEAFLLRALLPRDGSRVDRTGVLSLTRELAEGSVHEDAGTEGLPPGDEGSVTDRNEPPGSEPGWR